MSFFSSRLKELRKLYGLKQDDLAKLLGVSRPVISHYESGNQEPSLEIIDTLSKIFNVSTSCFVKPIQTQTAIFDYYPYYEMAFTPYVLSNQSHLLNYSFNTTNNSEDCVNETSSGSIHFECGLHPLGYYNEDEDDGYMPCCNFIILYNDTGDLENALLNQTIHLFNFLYIIHKELHILDKPFDIPYYDIYNRYYFKKRDNEIVSLKFSSQTGKIVLTSDNDYILERDNRMYQNLSFWFDRDKKERLKFAQDCYKHLIQKKLHVPESELNFEPNLTKLQPFRL